MNKVKMNYLFNIVKSILEKNIESRSDDFILISEVLKITNPNIKNMQIESILYNAKEFNIPSFESITRARRKIFKKYPNLNPKEISNIRKKEEKFYRSMAHEK